MFAIGHAAAFQPRGRLYVVSFAGLVAFLLPIAYEAGVTTQFAAVALVGIAMALLTTAAVHFALNRIREQRRRLQVLSDASASLDRSLDPAETLRAISRMAVPGLAPVCVVDALDGTGSIGSTVAATADPELAGEDRGLAARPAAQQPAPRRGRRPARRERALGGTGDRSPRGRGGGRTRARRGDGAGRLRVRGGLPDARPRAHPRDHHLLATRRPSGPSTGVW